MSIRVRVELLAEDKATQQFAEAALKQIGIGPREYHVVRGGTARTADAPARPSQNMRQWVSTEFPRALGRVASHRAGVQFSALLVVTDADNDTVEQRRMELEQAAVSEGLAEKLRRAAVYYWIPKRHIETWATYFANLGDRVTEEANYKRGHQLRGDSFSKAGRAFVDIRGGREREQVRLPALIAALKELDLLCQWREGRARR